MSLPFILKFSQLYNSLNLNVDRPMINIFKTEYCFQRLEPTHPVHEQNQLLHSAVNKSQIPSFVLLAVPGIFLRGGKFALKRIELCGLLVIKI